ncbi:MAG: hypothetical protein O7I42_20085 [Alphaproteobacteria bacterium]|nr:hypothetical protein [Alphaproteobacteria bacterium]
MAIGESTSNVTSRHWLRMPTPHARANSELFVFSGIAIFDQLKGTGSSWEGGTATIVANYGNVIPEGRAILPHHWTVNIQLASIFNANVANNTGWSVNDYRLRRFRNALGGDRVAVVEGKLIVRAEIAVRDIDAFIHRLSYDVTILGTVVDFQFGVDL